MYDLLLYNTQQTDQITQDIRYNNSYSFNVSVVPHVDVSHRTSVKEGSCLFSIQGNFSVNRKDLQALTLKGPAWENPVLDFLTVQHLNNE